MGYHNPLTITDKSVLGINFLFNADIKPVFIRDFVQSIDLPHQFIHIATGEDYYFTFHHPDPYFGNELLPWPYYSSLKKIDGQYRIYPLDLVSEEQEDKIFVEHIWQTYIRHKTHKKGQKAVADFLEFQYRNSVRDGPHEFIARVQRVLFASGAMLINEQEKSIEKIRLNKLIWEWIHTSREEIKKLIGEPMSENEDDIESRGEKPELKDSLFIPLHSKHKEVNRQIKCSMEKEEVIRKNYDIIYTTIVGIWTGELANGVKNKSEAQRKVINTLDIFYRNHRKGYGITAPEFLKVIIEGLITKRTRFVFNGIGYEPTDLVMLELRELVKNWVQLKTNELGKLIEQFQPLPANQVPSKGNDLTTAHYVLIEYFTEGGLRELPESPPFDKTVRHRELAEKYGKTSEDFKKAFQRIGRILNSMSLSSEQIKAYREDLLKVQNYFISNGNTDLAQKIQSELDSSKLN